MAGRFYHYRRGYLKVSMTGCAPERFFNICQGREIEVWEVCCKSGCYEFYMTVKGFKQAKTLARKAGVRLKILKKLGLPFFLYRNRKRKLSLAGFLLFFIFLYSMSLFLWDIEFEGNRRYTRDTLMDFLNSLDISYGMMTRNISCEDLEESIRMEFPEITWVSAQVSGTRLLVKIKENEVLSEIPQKDDSPCDIVAEKPGVITGMIVRSGTPAVQIGDQVEAGQVLVSGVLTITDDSETAVAYHYVHADAKITGMSFASLETSFPACRRIEAYTGKKKTGIVVRAFDHSFTIMLPFFHIPEPGDGKEEEPLPWKFVLEEKQARIFEDFYLPFYWGIAAGKEYQTYERPYEEEEKEELKGIVNAHFMENLEEKGVQIIRNDVRIQEGNGGFTVICQAQTEESLGVERPLQPAVRQEEAP